MRSFLFVPGDSARKFAKAREGAADALILDLEDSVAPAAKVAARCETAAMLAAPRGRHKIFVRVNALDTGLTLADLAAVMPGRPDGVVLPKSTCGADVLQLSHYLDAFEAAQAGAADPAVILAIVTETAGSLFGLGSYAGAGPRLWGMMWGAEDLSASLGALANGEGDSYSEPFRMARNLCLAGAAAAGVVAVDAICADVRNHARIAAEATAARRDGFGAKAVIHPDHVEIVNRAFTPDAVEIAQARRVLAALASAEGQGVAMLDGRMIDKPHERAALRLLAAAGETE